MSSKNIVFMIAVNAEDKKEYKYSINSWKHFCKKNNAELLLLENPVVDQNEMHIIFQRYYLFDMLEHNSVDYNQILMVDADTIVHPDCPNFFEVTDNNIVWYMMMVVMIGF